MSELANGKTITVCYGGVYHINVCGLSNDSFKAYLLLTLTLNLVSSSRLDDSGIMSTFKRGKCILTDRKDGVTFGNISKQDRDGHYVARIVLPKRKARV